MSCNAHSFLAPSLLACMTLCSTFSACATALESTHRGGASTPVEPYLVGVTETAPQRPYRVVSVSVDKHDMRASEPAAASDSVQDAMKAYAASRGAKMVWIERSMNRWQRRFYGWGLVWVDRPEDATPSKACKHWGFAEGLAAAQAAAKTCFGKLLRTRPALAGSVEILFEVDPWGGIRQAAPSPNSSRDTQVHACACLLYTSPSPRDQRGSRMPSSA